MFRCIGVDISHVQLFFICCTSHKRLASWVHLSVRVVIVGGQSGNSGFDLIFLLLSIFDFLWQLFGLVFI